MDGLNFSVAVVCPFVNMMLVLMLILMMMMMMRTLLLLMFRKWCESMNVNYNSIRKLFMLRSHCCCAIGARKNDLHLECFLWSTIYISHTCAECIMTKSWRCQTHKHCIYHIRYSRNFIGILFLHYPPMQIYIIYIYSLSGLQVFPRFPNLHPYSDLVYEQLYSAHTHHIYRQHKTIDN